MKIDPEEINFAYGIKKTITEAPYLYETGTITGNTTVVTRNNKTYYKLEGRGPGLSNVAFVNFKTYKANQVVQLHVFDECNSPNDFLAICKLDSVEINPLQAKLSGGDEETISFTVPDAGSHFVKIYYYQHVDNDPNLQPTTHNTIHAGYFRLEPYYNQYEWGYDAPAAQSIKIKSYYGWSVTSKPDWINLDKNTDRMGTKNVSIAPVGNPGDIRSGVIVFTERKSGDTVQLTVNQAANPHPNDIILSIDKAGLLNEVNKNVVIGVKLVGNTSYTITNNNQSIYNISPMSGSGDLTIKNINAANRNQPIRFNITGNVGISKDIEIYEDNNLVSCYCDCNNFNGCGCHRNTTHVHEDVTTCASDKTWPCPIHCEAYGGLACGTHDSCLSQCKSVCSPQERTCPEDCNLYSYTPASCGCYGAKQSCDWHTCTETCTCNGAYGSPTNCSWNSCSDTCSKSCSCNGAYGPNADCSWKSCSDTCSKSCSCNGAYGSASSCSWKTCSKSCTCNGAYGSASNCSWKSCSEMCSCHGSESCGANCSGHTGTYCNTVSWYWTCSIECESDTWGCNNDCPRFDWHAGNCEPDCGSNIECHDCGNDQLLCGGEQTCKCNAQYDKTCNMNTCKKACSCHGAYGDPTNCSWKSCSETCTCNGAYGSPTHCSWKSCSDTCSKSCSCNGAYGGATNCSWKSCSDTCSKSCTCNGAYGPNANCSWKSCNKTCTCNGPHKQCSSHEYNPATCPSDCDAKGESCNKQMIVGTNDGLCSCNDKTYYPHCDCDNYCPCQGYVIPQVG